MAYEEDDDYPQATSQTGMGLAQNPLMPMGDPLAYARVGAAPEASVPAIHTQGMTPQPIMQPRAINVPDIPGPHGGSSPNELQPSQAPPDSGLNMNSLQGLLQMKGMADFIQPSAVSAPGAGLVPAPGAGAGPGRAPAGASIAKAAAPYQDMINDAAKQNNVDPQTLTRLLYRESQFDPKAKSPAGAQGIGQFMPATAKEEGVDVNDPKSSIYGSAKYLRKMTDQFNGNEQLGMAAYNWGPGNVLAYLKTGRGLKGPIPQETLDYVQAISGKPLAPNMPQQRAYAPAAGAAPMAAMVAGQGGDFAIPPPHAGRSAQDQREQQIASAPESAIAGPTGVNPVVEQFNRPPVVRGGQTGVSPAVQEANRGQPSVQWPPKSGVYVPGATETPAPPTQNQPQQQQPMIQGQTPFGPGSDPMMQKLWRYMLIKSLFPQIQFRNIGYDPWAVHRFGQGGGY